MRHAKYVVLVLLAVLAACGTPEAEPELVAVQTATSPPTDTPVPPTNTPVPATDTPIPPTDTPIPPTDTPTPLQPVSRGLVDVGGYSLYIDCIGDGSPTVVLDSGLTGDSRQWEQVMSLLADNPPTRICAYDRLWQGQSASTAEVKKEPRTSQDVVDDLHTLLVNANIPGPYILVAHSAAGFNAQLFASQYPEEMAGIVLVDALHCDTHSRQMALLSPDLPDESGAIRLVREGSERPWTDPMSNRECLNLAVSATQVRATGTLDALPLVVLTHDVNRLEVIRQGFPDAFPAELVESLEQEWLALQEELAALSSNSTHIIVPDSGYNIPWENPESVVDAIRKVLEEVESKE